MLFNLTTDGPEGVACARRGSKCEIVGIQHTAEAGRGWAEYRPFTQHLREACVLPLRRNGIIEASKSSDSLMERKRSWNEVGQELGLEVRLGLILGGSWKRVVDRAFVSGRQATATIHSSHQRATVPGRRWMASPHNEEPESSEKPQASSALGSDCPVACALCWVTSANHSSMTSQRQEETTAFCCDNLALR
ncbi:hypothetical protein B0T21DRAFT_344574 [Apiosordaria backusii]|uniref:Uncharacterized protein n=1 Tax=Apiosordaria backusii TaxID=314023 RepID=A0AA40ERT9_9PEZI|nr:hypothetical protein B0T21DRAFT_344574 [Apiosordaria backusii]